eukprot:2593823-Amphidinium_carterae.1
MAPKNVTGGRATPRAQGSGRRDGRLPQGRVVERGPATLHENDIDHAGMKAVQERLKVLHDGGGFGSLARHPDRRNGQGVQLTLHNKSEGGHEGADARR